jgi:uncharacterized protein with GYD domain
MCSVVAHCRFRTEDRRKLANDTLKSIGIEVLDFRSVESLVASFGAHSFAAIVLEDDDDCIRPWLDMLQTHVDSALRRSS